VSVAGPIVAVPLLVAVKSLELWVASIGLTASVLVACSGAGPSPSDDGDARIAAVQSALNQPTGTVSPSSVSALAADWRSFETAAAVFDAVLSVGTEAAQACLTGAIEPDAATLGAAAEVADAGSPAVQAGSYDLACVTEGKVTGRLSVRLLPPSFASADAGSGQQLDIALEDACSGDACVTADAFASIAPPEPRGCGALVTLAFTATVTQAGISRVLSFGAEGGLGRSNLTGVTVYFDDDGRSLTVQADPGASPSADGPYLVTGAGSSYECTLGSHGGRCDGATTFTY